MPRVSAATRSIPARRWRRPMTPTSHHRKLWLRWPRIPADEHSSILMIFNPSSRRCARIHPSITCLDITARIRHGMAVSAGSRCKSKTEPGRGWTFAAVTMLRPISRMRRRKIANVNCRNNCNRIWRAPIFPSIFPPDIFALLIIDTSCRFQSSYPARRFHLSVRTSRTVRRSI